jgi:enterochelin esterase-like enzyme
MYAARSVSISARTLVAAATLILPLQVSGQPTPRPLPLAEAFVVRSEILNEDRELQVSLPESYSRTTVKYPVLFVLDGSSNILHATASVQSLARARNRIPEAIVVAIPNRNRNRDLTPGTGAVTFARVLAEELIPWVESHYRAAPERILWGHSPNTHDSLGDAYCRSGDREAGRRSYQDAARVAAARTPPASRLTEYQAKAAKGCDP